MNSTRGPKLAAAIVEQLAAVVLLSRGELDKPTGAPGESKSRLAARETLQMKSDCAAAARCSSTGTPYRAVSIWRRSPMAPKIVTVEHLAANGKLDPVQEAFIETGAFQCGSAPPGFVLMTKQLLDEHPDPSDDQIGHYLSGNLCRCGAYPEIIAAVKLAARIRRRRLISPRRHEEHKAVGWAERSEAHQYGIAAVDGLRCAQPHPTWCGGTNGLAGRAP